MDRDGNIRDVKLINKLSIAILLTAIIFIVELAGGFWTSSLALLSDAMHVFMDLFALSLSLFAIYISKLPPNSNKTFGFHRGEVLAALFNGLSLLIISLSILYHAYLRINEPVHVKGFEMFWVALIGLIVNLLVAYWLMESSKSDLNIRSAFLHVVGDLIASVGVIIASIVIYYTGFMLIDPIISVFIGAILIYGSVKVILEAIHILLEGVPKDIDLDEVVRHVINCNGVSGVHSIHLWSICHNVFSLSAHLDLEEDCSGNRGDIIDEVNHMLEEKYKIRYTTLQLDCSNCDNTLYRNIEHGENNDSGYIHSH